MSMTYCPLEEAIDEADTSAETHDLIPDFYQDPALTMASLLRMMSRFPSRCSPALAQSIAAHLQMLVADGRQHPEIRLCAAELMEGWSHTATLLETSHTGDTFSQALH